MYALRDWLTIIVGFSKDIKQVSSRTKQHEVWLIIMRLLSVLMSRTKSPYKTASEVNKCYDSLNGPLRDFFISLYDFFFCFKMLSPVQKDATLLANNSRHLFCSFYRRSRSATMLDPFTRFFQHCRGHARSLPVDYKDLWAVYFPRCSAGPKLVGSCCIRLHTTANTHATTPNIVGATMLGVVAPVCTQP